MIETPPEAFVVAYVIPCEQYRFRVKLPPTMDRQVRADLRRRALQDVTNTFLDCTRRYQAIAWVGVANLAFMHSPSSPRDSKSSLFHLLICLKVMELSLHYYRENQPDGATRDYGLAVQTAILLEGRVALSKFSKEFGLRLLYSPTGEVKPLGRVGGAFRARQHSADRFSPQPIKRIRDYRADVARKLKGQPFVRRCVKKVLYGVGQLFWPMLIAARILFTLWYRPAAARLLKRLDSSRNVFVYFDSRDGRSLDVGGYLRWKYGASLRTDAGAGSSLILFSHLSQAETSYSLSAMRWAGQTLRHMSKQPSEGCVVVNYLIPPLFLLKLHFRRRSQMIRKRRRLRQMKKESQDFVSRMIFEDFIKTLEKTKAFAMEVSKGHERFFRMVTPGVVLQADAIAKTARQFTACARKGGSRVVYVADRICTEHRTSNQLIGDEGANLHFPDRTVVFDQVTRDEFIRQGIPETRIHSYCRNFSLAPPATPGMSPPKHKQVVVFLQDYPDNMGAMIHVGTDVAARFPNLHVIFQQHPNFPVCEKAKVKLLLESPGRLHFHQPGESIDYSRTVALITGYSTAVVPGVLQGVPLIWLRRPIDNSVYGQAYLERIGFAADNAADAIVIMKRLLRRNSASLQECVAATAEAKAIFTPVSAGDGRSLSAALGQALSESFEEIAAQPVGIPQAARNSLAPVQV